MSGQLFGVLNVFPMGWLGKKQQLHFLNQVMDWNLFSSAVLWKQDLMKGLLENTNNKPTQRKPLLGDQRSHVKWWEIWDQVLLSRSMELNHSYPTECSFPKAAGSTFVSQLYAIQNEIKWKNSVSSLTVWCIELFFGIWEISRAERGT